MRSVMILLSLFLIAAAGQVYGEDYETDSLREGYLEGFRHGNEDLRTGVNFDYKHAPEFQTNRYYGNIENCEFRLAYVEGYTDAYYRHPSRYRVSTVPTIPAGDQTHAYGNRRKAGFATVFDDPNYGGENSQFQIGRYEELPEGWNDDIESLQLSGGVRVILYDEEEFAGEKLVIERDTSDLHDFQNKAASMVVEPMQGGFVSAFKEPGFQGTVREFEIGRYSALDGDWDDEIESLQLSGSIRVILFDEKNFQGERMIVERDSMDLGDFRKKAASMIVEPF